MFSMSYQNIFSSTVLSEITIPSSITSMGTSIFKCCSYVSILVLNDGLTVLGKDMFDMSNFNKNPTLLSKVTIPSTITNIGSGTFGLCSVISKVVFKDGLTVLGS